MEPRTLPWDGMFRPVGAGDLLPHLLRQGYEGQEGYEGQDGVA